MGTIKIILEARFRSEIESEKQRIQSYPNIESKIVETLRFCHKIKSIDEYISISYFPFFIGCTKKELESALEKIFSPFSIRERLEATNVNSIGPLYMDPYLAYKVSKQDLSIADAENYFIELEEIRRVIAEFVYPGIRVRLKSLGEV